MFTFEEIIQDKEYRERIIKYFRLPMRLSISKEKFIEDFEFLKHMNKEEAEKIIKFTEKDFNHLAREQGVFSLQSDNNVIDSDNQENVVDFTMETDIEKLITTIENTLAWKNFILKDYASKITLDNKVGTNTHQFYKIENDGKNFVSIDLKQANWQSLQTIVGFNETYETTIKKYTDKSIPPISKTFRTKITGMIGGKNIMEYNKYLLYKNKKSIIDNIHKSIGLDLRNKPISAFYADEFLIELTADELLKLQNTNLDKLEDVIFDEVGIDVHVVPFTLKWLGVEKSCAKIYKKEYEIINISKDILLLMNKLSADYPINFEIDFEKIKLKSQSKSDFINKLKSINEDLKLIANNQLK